MSRHPHIAATDPELDDLLGQEERRQAECIRLIPSENYVSSAVLEATGSVLTNKYSEGYPGRRYYEGQQVIDQVEQLARDRAKALFSADFANVQPYSGSPANLAVYFAFCQPGDTVMGMALPHGGHLTHGWNVSISGAYFNSVQYGVDRETQRIDYDQVRALALEHRPKLLWAGATAYPRVIDFEAFASIAKEIDALFIADIAHIAGLVAGGAHPSPVPHADVVTTTTHKTLRGPRGGMILCKKAHRKKINAAVFPGLQGGPHNHTTAALAVALKEAATPAFKQYAAQIVQNSRALAEALLARGFDLVTGGSDNHLLLIDLTAKNVPGKVAAQALDRAGIVCNYNTVPFDPRKPFDPSGLRLGTPAITSRGMGLEQMKQLGHWIDQVVAAPEDETVIARIRGEVIELCAQFPAPGLAD
ncbi:MAG: serine hydroxymethyltransferase [Deltaproteobacteria bacterium]|nr:serine hydroxymethyltransferase [Deltaproteobacteria bacterium]